MADRVVVFVHGWSVYKTDTYGRLPERLAAEGAARGLGLEIEHVYLAKYVSFRDEVRVEDISRALESALRNEAPIAQALAAGKRLVIVTHSTGGPVVRDWWWRHYGAKKLDCPMSHLIMLAPANFGSSLAQLGKSVLSRVMKRFEHVEPGSGTLDWLELGSPDAWKLNEDWIYSTPSWKLAQPVFQFVLTGQSIDRSVYDHVNSYTDEVGSDGVVRVPSANLNSTYVELTQAWDRATEKGPELVVSAKRNAPRTAFAVLPGLSHSGDKMGILRSVKKSGAHATVDAVLECLAVDDAAGYEALCTKFEDLTAKTQAAERLELQDGLFFTTREFVHDVTTQLVVRLRDSAGYTLGDFDFLLTACDPEHENPRLRIPSPDLLPGGFFIDRQRNSRSKSTLTYYLNYDVMAGCPAIENEGERVRAAQPGAASLGLRVVPRPQPDPKDKKSKLLVHYATAELAASSKVLREFVKPNQTLMLDIVMKRVVRQGVLKLTRGERGRDFKNEDFREQEAGPSLD